MKVQNSPSWVKSIRLVLDRVIIIFSVKGFSYASLNLSQFCIATNDLNKNTLNGTKHELLRVFFSLSYFSGKNI